VHRNEHTVEIDAPAAAVFPYLAASEQRLRWMGALKESEPLGEGPPQRGSRWRDIFEDHGHRIELEAELVEYAPHERLRISLHGKGFEATSEQRLEEASGRTRLTTVLETNYRSIAARLVASVVTRHAQKRLEGDLAALKELVEREA
jgi:uncharacterized membrane protein